MSLHSGSPTKFYIEEYKDGKWSLIDVRFREVDAQAIASEHSDHKNRPTRVLALRAIAQYGSNSLE